MGARLSRAASSTHFNSIDRRPAKASIRVNPLETRGVFGLTDEAVSLVLESLAAIGLSDKAACIDMGFDPGQFSRVKRGDARLPLDALWRLPDEFWSEFTARAMRARGLCEQTQREQRAARIAELVRLLVQEVA